MSWAHPKYGNILASCGFDKRVIIWKEVRAQDWDRAEEFVFESSVNSVQWGPWEYGLILACGTSDGKVSVIERHADDSWERKDFDAHESGVNSLAWGPSTYPSLIGFDVGTTGDQMAPRRFVTGGLDGNVFIWNFKSTEKIWEK